MSVCQCFIQFHLNCKRLWLQTSYIIVYYDLVHETADHDLWPFECQIHTTLIPTIQSVTVIVEGGIWYHYSSAFGPVSFGLKAVKGDLWKAEEERRESPLLWDDGNVREGLRSRRSRWPGEKPTASYLYNGQVHLYTHVCMHVCTCVHARTHTHKLYLLIYLLILIFIIFCSKMHT